MSGFLSSAVQIPTYSGEIYGTLTFQTKESRSVGLLLLSDGGAIDRNGNSADGFNTSDCLKLVAQELAVYGICSLRYDKRGTGLSEMPAYYAGEMHLDDFVEDAIHAVQYLKNELGFAKVIVAGHGEGSLVGMLAAERAPIDAFISIAGLTSNAASILIDQLQLRLSGHLLEQAHSIINQLRDGCIVDAVPDEFESLFGLNVQPYLISLFKHEPGEVINSIDIPTLVIHGDCDLQIKSTGVNKLSSNSTDATVRLIKGMNHVLKHVEKHSGNQLTQYRDGSLPLSEQLIPTMTAFIAQVVGNRGNVDNDFERESENLLELI